MNVTVRGVLIAYFVLFLGSMLMAFIAHYMLITLPLPVEPDGDKDIHDEVIEFSKAMLNLVVASFGALLGSLGLILATLKDKGPEKPPTEATKPPESGG